QQRSRALITQSYRNPALIFWRQRPTSLGETSSYELRDCVAIGVTESYMTRFLVAHTAPTCTILSSVSAPLFFAAE
ncbi:MAG: hypothetical protein AAFY60_16280, partial [Myxococcota bacterium]